MLPRQPPVWVRGYERLTYRDLGRDRAGVDCYGLYRLVLAEQAGMILPAYDGAVAEGADRAERAAMIAGQMGPWVEVPQSGLHLFDGVLLRLGGEPCHIGMVVARGRMLHIQRGAESAIARLDSIGWRHRIAGYFRYCPEEAGDAA